ncbi:Hypothetical predicted protein [Octopus vulgaris]|uniref:Uncharacterized protein n=1 Tax=Octopus vulgaris TaxID=6645 RepID=A0AA36F6H7_OCTVU|nr:Hypothetical predicted protein [Octopus vulgaris]
MENLDNLTFDRPERKATHGIVGGTFDKHAEDFVDKGEKPSHTRRRTTVEAAITRITTLTHSQCNKRACLSGGWTLKHGKSYMQKVTKVIKQLKNYKAPVLMESNSERYRGITRKDLQ